MDFNHFLFFILIFINILLIESQIIYSGTIWNDTNGNRIEAHGNGILIDPNDKSYWWFGESQKTDSILLHGINCYHSKDLINWNFNGQALKQSQIQIKDHPGPYIIERPKVVWNNQTKLYVMWFHLDNQKYQYRFVGVATSLTPNGIFTFVKAFQPDGIPSLDMTLFQDQINRVYFIRSCNNEYVGISQLDETYLNTTGIISKINQAREGPALFYRNNRYYMITSHLTGWSPNAADLFITDRDNLLDANWISLGNPTNSLTTFNSQSSFVVEYPSKKYPNTSYFIFMADRWNFPHLLNATYVWLPFIFHSDVNVTIPWKDQWSLNDY